MASVVLVVDMLRGFLEEGYSLYCGSQARRIIPAVQSLLEEELARGSRVCFLCDHHAPDDLEFKMFPPHCIEGTAEAELIPELAGFNKVGIFVSGGLDPERITHFIESGAPVDAFGIGSYISGAKPIDFTADLHEVEGKPIAKRGRIPGITPNPRLKRTL